MLGLHCVNNQLHSQRQKYEYHSETTLTNKQVSFITCFYLEWQDYI